MSGTALARPEDDQALSRSSEITPRSIHYFLSKRKLYRQPLDKVWDDLSEAIHANTTATSGQRHAECSAVDFPLTGQSGIDILDQMCFFVSAEPTSPISNIQAAVPAPEAPAVKSPAQAALAAVCDIQEWLALGQDEVAELAGFAPRSVKNWREGMDPYPATVRRLFDLHALLGSLKQSMGRDRMRLWLDDSGAPGVSRRERLRENAGLRSVIAEAATMLFEAPAVAPLQSLDFEEEVQLDLASRSEAFSGPVRRVGRRPRSTGHA